MKRLCAPIMAGTMVLMAACSHAPKEAVPAPPVADLVEEEVPVAIEPLELPPTTRERVQRAMQFLSDGEEAKAIVEIDAVLADSPQHATALKLQEQILTDPEELLGQTHISYTVQSGDTTSSLAKTYLGDALMFYALARYNELEAANRLSVGQTLKVPDQFLAGLTSEEVAKEETEPAEDLEPVEAVETPTPFEVAEANRLRLQALEQLNAGESEEAMKLLRRAQSLDGNNANITADLAKVERIRAALSQ